MQNTAQLLADREPLLWSQDDARMLSPGVRPLRVQPIEIGSIERVQHAIAFCGKGQLFLVGLPKEANVQRRSRVNTSSTESRDKSIVHRVFVDVDPD